MDETKVRYNVNQTQPEHNVHDFILPALVLVFSVYMLRTLKEQEFLYIHSNL